MFPVLWKTSTLSLSCSRFLALQDSKSSLETEDPDAYDEDSYGEEDSNGEESDAEIVGKEIPNPGVTGVEVGAEVPDVPSADPQPESASARPSPEQGGSPSQAENLRVLTQEADAEGGELGGTGLPVTWVWLMEST